jgi:hypothetical protein
MNRVLRKIFRSKREALTGEWRKLYNAEFRNSYSTAHVISV